MYSSKQKLSLDDQDSTSLTKTSTCSDVDSPIRSYALIETDPDELEHIVDLLRQFFPKTKIIEYNNQNNSSRVIAPQLQSSESDDQLSSNTNSQAFKGKVKDYLQRRYLEQIGENKTRNEILTKSRDDNISSLDLSSSITINKCLKRSKSRSLDLTSIRTEKSSIIRSTNKRRSVKRSSTIDTDDSSDDSTKKIVNIDQSNKDDDDDDDDEEEKSHSVRYPYSEQQTNKTNQFLVPFTQTCEQEQTYSSGMPLLIPPYSAASDPGPFRSPWFNTPTSSFNFRFPQSEEQPSVNAQGSIVELSTLTKMFCDEPSVFTPISPRFKKEKHDSNPPKDSSSVPPCQICGQEFDSHQMYLTHYRKHLENSCEDNKSDILDSDINCDRSSDLRNYLCTICSKRFSRSDMLNRHLRSHSGVRPYRCTMCNTNFSRSDHLSTHLRTHTGEKPYTCPQCSYSACRRDMITRHLKIHRKQRSERKNATSTFASSNDS